MLMPGRAGLGEVKQWPIARYAEVARSLLSRGLTPVVIGGQPEVALVKTIQVACPDAVDLAGRTTIEEIAALGAHTTLVLGNDTGPVHLAARQPVSPSQD